MTIPPTLGWFAGRLPEEWRSVPAEITIDREEITVRLTVPDVELDGDASAAARSEARAGRAKAFREETRSARMLIAEDAQACHLALDRDTRRSAYPGTWQ